MDTTTPRSWDERIDTGPEMPFDPARYIRMVINGEVAEVTVCPWRERELDTRRRIRILLGQTP